VLHAASCVLHAASCVLHAASCVLHVACCLVRVACCMLRAVQQCCDFAGRRSLMALENEQAVLSRCCLKSRRVPFTYSAIGEELHIPAAACEPQRFPQADRIPHSTGPSAPSAPSAPHPRMRWQSTALICEIRASPAGTPGRAL
jgi:hypothetical protein